MLYKYLRIGKIVNTHGIKGEVRVVPLTENIQRFNDLKYVYLDDEKLINMNVDYVKYHKNNVILKFKGLDSIDEAEKLKGIYILVNRENAMALPEGSYFICDLIGICVYDVEGKNLGSITDILNTGSNDVYVVRDGKNELLIPALKTVVKEINIQDNRIIVDLPEGLI